MQSLDIIVIAHSGGTPVALYAAGRTTVQTVRRNIECTEQCGYGRSHTDVVSIWFRIRNSKKIDAELKLAAVWRTKVAQPVWPARPIWVSCWVVCYMAGGAVDSRELTNGRRTIVAKSNLVGRTDACKIGFMDLSLSALESAQIQMRAVKMPLSCQMTSLCGRPRLPVRREIASWQFRSDKHMRRRRTTDLIINASSVASRRRAARRTKVFHSEEYWMCTTIRRGRLSQNSLYMLSHIDQILLAVMVWCCFSIFDRWLVNLLYSASKKKAQETLLWSISSPNVVDFRNSFTSGLSIKFATRMWLKIPLHLKRFITLYMQNFSLQKMIWFVNTVI